MDKIKVREKVWVREAWRIVLEEDIQIEARFFEKGDSIWLVTEGTDCLTMYTDDDFRRKFEIVSE